MKFAHHLFSVNRMIHFSTKIKHQKSPLKPKSCKGRLLWLFWWVTVGHIFYNHYCWNILLWNCRNKRNNAATIPSHIGRQKWANNSPWQWPTTRFANDAAEITWFQRFCPWPFQVPWWFPVIEVKKTKQTDIECAFKEFISFRTPESYLIEINKLAPRWQKCVDC